MGSTRYRVNAPGVVHQTIDGEVVIINLTSGHYYSLDKLGASVWALLEAAADVGEVTEHLASTYDAPRQEIDRAVLGLVGRLEEEQLIVPGVPGGPVSSGPVAAPEAGRPRLMFEPPVLQKYADMQDLLLLDPIHEVDEAGWPRAKADVDEGGARA